MKKTYKIEVDCANCANKMEDATKKYFQEFAFHACKTIQFELARLGNDAGMYGGAASAL